MNQFDTTGPQAAAAEGALRSARTLEGRGPEAVSVMLGLIENMASEAEEETGN